MYTAVAIVIVWIPITALVAYVSVKLIKRALRIADGQIDQIRDCWCDGRVPQERLSAPAQSRSVREVAARVVWRAWAVEVKVWAALWAAVAKWAAVMAADAAAEVELAREIGEEIKR